MQLTTEQCAQFMTDQNKNPLTGRRIEAGKATHKQLLKICQHESEPTLNAPPCGPMVHWGIQAHGKAKLKNLVKMMNYIEKRIAELDKSPTQSLMELKDYLEIMRFAKEEFANKPGFVANLNAAISKLENFKRRKYVQDDEPKYIVVNGWTVYSRRFANREEIAFIAKMYANALAAVNEVVQTQKFNTGIAPADIRRLKEGKGYLDYLIAHNVFSYDDIYKTTFAGEHVFDDLAEKFKEYRKVYKKVFNESL